jgi:hypothetical protein
MIVVDVGQLDDDEGVGPQRFRFGTKKELIFATVDLVVKLAFAVQDGAAGGGRVVDKEIFFVGIFEQPKLDDSVLVSTFKTFFSSSLTIMQNS